MRKLLRKTYLPGEQNIIAALQAHRFGDAFGIFQPEKSKHKLTRFYQENIEPNEASFIMKIACTFYHEIK
jgi:hypothetical protein